MSENPNDPTFHERRQSLKLRLLYPEASAHLRHIFRRHRAWAGTSSDFLALRVIHERFQDLTSREVRTLVLASARNPCLPEGVLRLVA